MFKGPELPMMVLFMSIAAIFIMRGPFGRAIAERLDFAERLLARQDERAALPKHGAE